MEQLEAMCLDCEEQWDPNLEPIHCICDDPDYDAWLLFLRDDSGKWIRTTMEAIDNRYYKEKRN